jgi:hypothetical protein
LPAFSLTGFPDNMWVVRMQPFISIIYSIEWEGSHYLTTCPLAPPYVPFGIRRFVRKDYWCYWLHQYTQLLLSFTFGVPAYPQISSSLTFSAVCFLDKPGNHSSSLTFRPSCFHETSHPSDELVSNSTVKSADFFKLIPTSLLGLMQCDWLHITSSCLKISQGKCIRFSFT